MRKAELYKHRMELIKALSAALSLCFFLAKEGFYDHRNTSAGFRETKSFMFDLCVT